MCDFVICWRQQTGARFGGVMRANRKKQSTMIFLAVDVDRQTVPKNVISPSRGVGSANFPLFPPGGGHHFSKTHSLGLRVALQYDMIPHTTTIGKVHLLIVALEIETNLNLQCIRTKDDFAIFKQ